ncbi:MAG: hypothetical protein N2746_10305 [Deltaproteobacteria bacterium]|nr:hypothetical protein [Deltaproteobacteria bacterium]
MMIIYETLFTILFIILFPALFLFPRIRNTIFDRLYIFKKEKGTISSIWFHGASAGDILSIKPVIEFFYNRYKRDYGILISSNTESGRDIVRKFFPSDIKFAYLPFDLSFSINRFLEAYKPVVLFVEASEFWPILVHRLSKNGIKIILINGNIKKESLLFYKILAYLTSNMFGKYTMMIVRNEESANMARLLGVDEKKILVCTNTKYKSVIDMQRKDIHQNLRLRFQNIGRVVVFGSIHYEEEDDVIYVVERLVSEFDDIKIIVAPRHLERKEHMRKKLRMINTPREIIVSYFTDEHSDFDIMIVDTIGDLFYLYSFASVAFVGGSLCDRGGHNVLEPAAWGVPVLTGRNVRNYEDIVKTLLGFGLILVNNREELFATMSEILRNDLHRKRLSDLISSKVLELEKEFSKVESILEQVSSIS